MHIICDLHQQRHSYTINFGGIHEASTNLISIDRGHDQNILSLVHTQGKRLRPEPCESASIGRRVMSMEHHNDCSHLLTDSFHRVQHSPVALQEYNE